MVWQGTAQEKMEELLAKHRDVFVQDHAEAAVTKSNKEDLGVLPFS
jgi:hypothetical protein